MEQDPLEGDEEELVQFTRTEMAEDVGIKLSEEEEKTLDYRLKGPIFLEERRLPG